MNSAATGVPDPITVVLGDANVLYSRVIREYLVYAGDQRAISIRWSAAILDEVVEHLALNRATFTVEDGARLVSLLNRAYPYAQVEPSSDSWERVALLPLPVARCPLPVAR